MKHGELIYNDQLKKILDENITEKLEKLFALDLFILFEYIDNSKKLLILWL
jgi:hypothetical protein